MNDIHIGRKDILSLGEIGSTRNKDGSGGGFSQVLSKAVNEVNDLHKNADEAVLNIQAGRTENLHEAVIALEKADMAFRTLLTVRNKLLDAYQEIMRMQV